VSGKGNKVMGGCGMADVPSISILACLCCPGGRATTSVCGGPSCCHRRESALCEWCFC